MENGNPLSVLARPWLSGEGFFMIMEFMDFMDFMDYMAAVPRLSGERIFHDNGIYGIYGY